MKSTTEYLTFNLPERMGFENITPRVEAIVRKSGVQEGLVLCNAMHITASVFINDDESGLHATTRNGSKHWRPSIRHRRAISTIAPARIMPTHT